MSGLAVDVLVPLSTPDTFACRLGRLDFAVGAPPTRLGAGLAVEPCAEVLANGT